MLQRTFKQIVHRTPTNSRLVYCRAVLFCAMILKLQVIANHIARSKKARVNTCKVVGYLLFLNRLAVTTTYNRFTPQGVFLFYSVGRVVTTHQGAIKNLAHTASPSGHK